MKIKIIYFLIILPLSSFIVTQDSNASLVITHVYRGVSAGDFNEISSEHLGKFNTSVEGYVWYDEGYVWYDYDPYFGPIREPILYSKAEQNSLIKSENNSLVIEGNGSIYYYDYDYDYYYDDSYMESCNYSTIELAFTIDKIYSYALRGQFTGESFLKFEASNLNIDWDNADLRNIDWNNVGGVDDFYNDYVNKVGILISGDYNITIEARPQCYEGVFEDILFTMHPIATPIPTPFWLFISGIVTLLGVKKNKPKEL